MPSVHWIVRWAVTAAAAVAASGAVAPVVSASSSSVGPAFVPTPPVSAAAPPRLNVPVRARPEWAVVASFSPPSAAAAGGVPPVPLPGQTPSLGRMGGGRSIGVCMAAGGGRRHHHHHHRRGVPTRLFLDAGQTDGNAADSPREDGDRFRAGSDPFAGGGATWTGDPNQVTHAANNRLWKRTKKAARLWMKAALIWIRKRWGIISAAGLLLVFVEYGINGRFRLLAPILKVQARPLTDWSILAAAYGVIAAFIAGIMSFDMSDNAIALAASIRKEDLELAAKIRSQDHLVRRVERLEDAITDLHNRRRSAFLPWDRKDIDEDIKVATDRLKKLYDNNPGVLW
jgi:hypothetical protein